MTFLWRTSTARKCVSGASENTRIVADYRFVRKEKRAVGKAISISFIPLFLVSAILGVYLAVSPLSSTSTTNMQTYSTLPTSAVTTNSSLGLELGLSINSTVINPGDSINVTISILNVLPIPNNVSAESNWAVPVMDNFSASTFPCPRWENFLVFEGYYDESNISSAAPVWLVPPHQAPACPFLNWPSYSFQPQSLNVGVGRYPQSYNLTTKALVDGYYTTSQGFVLPSRNLPPPPFQKGIYTIAAADEWGQLVMLHFEVG